MKQFKKIIKAFGYSFQLIYSSSKLLILVYGLLKLATATLPLLSVWVLKCLLDHLVAEEPNLSAAIYYIVLYIACLLLLSIINAATSVCYNSIFQRAEHQYDRNISEKAVELPLSVLDTSEGRNLIDEVQFAKETVVYLVERAISIISLLYTVVIAFCTLFAFHAGFSLLFVILAVPGMFLGEYFERKSDILRRKMAPDVRKSSYYRWMLTDVWPAKDVRMYDLTTPIKARYNEEKRTYLKANKRLDVKKTFSLIIAELIQRAGEIVFTLFVVYKALIGEISVGDVALYIGFAISFCDSFQNMSWLVRQVFTRTTERIESLFSFLGIHCADETNGARQIDRFETLRFEDVYFKYPTAEEYVLKGVSFTLKQGEKLSIIGINGAGKSTIVKLMLGLYEIDSGRILVNDYPISDYNVKDIRQMFSVLFQTFAQYPLTLRENVAFSGLERIEKDEEIEEALKKSGVYNELVPKLNNGLDSLMTRQFDDEGTELSKGQWQKVALSRTYFKNAPIVIFDEPSAALDAEAEEHIFRNFEEISSDKTGIMISHRISSARMASKIIVLDGGRIAEEGTHDELIGIGGLYAKLYELQRKKYTV